MAESVTEENVKEDMKNWDFSPHVVELESSIIREILKISSQPGVISFAGGLPAPDMFPLEIIKQAAINVISEYKSDALQYTYSSGIPLLREAIAARETAAGIPTSPENILITSGSQQGIEIIARAFIDPEDFIITEYPTYVGAIQAFDFYQTRYASIDMDNDGLLVDQVEDYIKNYNAKLIYTVSNFQNPTGITMSLERRKALIDLARSYDIPIIDDNPYCEIRYVGEPIPTLKELGGDSVISLGTFSKICAPGLRIAWMNVANEALPMFEKVKQCTDLHTNTFAQYIINDFIRSGKLEGHIERLKEDYGAKRNLMLAEMEKHFPSEFNWTRPEGGLFLWTEMPESMSGSELLVKAIERKVAYVYGSPFYPDKKGDNTFRLNFSNASLENISEGIRRLGELFKENLS